MLNHYKRNVSKTTILLLTLGFYYVYFSFHELTNKAFVYGINVKSEDDQIRDLIRSKQEILKNKTSFKNYFLPFFLKSKTFLRNENVTRSIWTLKPSSFFSIKKQFIVKSIQSILFLETFIYFLLSVALSYFFYSTRFGQSCNKNFNTLLLKSMDTRFMSYPAVISHSGFVSSNFNLKHDDLEMKLMSNLSTSKYNSIWGHVAKKKFLCLFLLANICRCLINALLLQRSLALLKTNDKDNAAISQFLSYADDVNNIPTLIFLLSYNIVIVFLTKLCYLDCRSAMHTIAEIFQTITIAVTFLFPIYVLLTYYNILSYYVKYVSLIMVALHITTSILLFFLGLKVSFDLQKKGESKLKSSNVNSLSSKIILFTALLSFFLLLKSCLFLWCSQPALDLNGIPFVPFIFNHVICLLVEIVPNLLIFKLTAQKTFCKKDELN